MPPKASKRKAANGYKLPEKLPEGLVITAINKKSFRLGKSIGVGGFGEIYLASEDVSRPVGDDATLALKIEPHENGPLFVEMNFYIRAAQPEAVAEFGRSRGLGPSFGMPCLRASGSHVHAGQRYRFLVMDRFGKDLQKVFQTGKKVFSDRVTYNLALKVTDVLEYVHSKGYVHNDIKAQNLLLGHGRTRENDVYLVDFGLVSKYAKDGVHVEYKPDARKAHDGTIEYTSRDAHIGAHSRRSDLEILAYNLVHWMSGDLPWMDNLANPGYVQAQKKGYMNDVPAFLQRCFKSQDYPDVLETFLNYVTGLEFDTEPDYGKIRKMFTAALAKKNYPLDGKIDFSAPKSSSAAKKSRKRKKSEFEDIDFTEESTMYRKSTRRVNGADSLSSEASSSKPEACNNDWSWEKVLCSDPELLIRQASRQSEAEDDSPLAQLRRSQDEQRQAESLKNPTDAMLQIIRRMEEREREREQMTSWHQQLQHLNKRTWDGTPNPLTPAMEAVIRMRQKRISVEIDTPITPDPSDSSSDDEDYVPPSALKRLPAETHEHGFVEPPHARAKRSSMCAVNYYEEDSNDSNCFLGLLSGHESSFSVGQEGRDLPSTSSEAVKGKRVLKKGRKRRKGQALKRDGPPSLTGLVNGTLSSSEDGPVAIKRSRKLEDTTTSNIHDNSEALEDHEAISSFGSRPKGQNGHKAAKKGSGKRKASTSGDSGSSDDVHEPISAVDGGPAGGKGRKRPGKWLNVGHVGSLSQCQGSSDIQERKASTSSDESGVFNGFAPQDCALPGKSGQMKTRKKYYEGRADILDTIHETTKKGRPKKKVGKNNHTEGCEEITEAHERLDGLHADAKGQRKSRMRSTDEASSEDGREAAKKGRSKKSATNGESPTTSEGHSKSRKKSTEGHNESESETANDGRNGHKAVKKGRSKQKSGASNDPASCEDDLAPNGGRDGYGAVAIGQRKPRPNEGQSGRADEGRKVTRRISIQNDASPIRNKNSPPVAKKAAKAKVRERFVLAEDVVSKKARKAGDIKPKMAGKSPGSSRRSSFASDVSDLSRPRKATRSRDATLRTTRANDWSWENVLAVNPEKIARKK